MKILIAGSKEERNLWVKAFGGVAGASFAETDPAAGLEGYREYEAVERFGAALDEASADAVCVAVERRYRAAVALEAARRGCHALVVPPTGDTPEEREALIRAAADSGAKLMVAIDEVFRPGILRLLALVSRGAVGVPSAVLYRLVNMRDEIGRLNNVRFSAEAYHSVEKKFTGFVCLCNLLTGGTDFREEVFYDLRNPQRTKLNLNYGNVRVEIGFPRSLEYNWEMGRVNELDSRAMEPLEKLFVSGDKGEITYSFTGGLELLSLKIQGKKKIEKILPGDSRSAMAGYFAEFVGKGIEPFVNGRVAEEGAAGARKLLTAVIDEGKKYITSAGAAEKLPDFWKGLSGVSGMPGSENRPLSLDDYRKLFDWSVKGGFGIKLIAAPMRSRADCKGKLFSSFALPVLSGVAARHGCVVETDDLTRLMLIPGALEQEEIEKIWPKDTREMAPCPEEVLRKAAAKAAAAMAFSSLRLIGISFQEESHFRFALAFCREVKKLTDTPIALGGAMNFDLDEARDCVDFIIRGEGEAPLLCLVRHIAEGWPLENVPCLMYPMPDDYVNPNIIADIRIRGLPVYNPELMKLYERKGVTIYPYMFVNGCPHACGFCTNFSRGTMRMLDTPEVMRQLESIVKMYGARHFYFLNHLLNFNKKYFHQFLDGLQNSGLDIRWSDSACLTGLDDAELRKMRAAGCRKITWGLDTGSDRLARLMRKPIRLKEAEAILARSRAAGIHNVVNLIVGLPHETPADIADTLKLLERNMDVLSGVCVNPYYYAVTSPVFHDPEKYNLVKKGGSFDEIGGLKWDAKIDQNNRHVEIVTEFLAGHESQLSLDDWDMMSD